MLCHHRAFDIHLFPARLCLQLTGTLLHGSPFFFGKSSVRFLLGHVRIPQKDYNPALWV